MKTIFIDCYDQLDQVFARVHRPDDPPIAVNTGPVEPADLPGLTLMRRAIDIVRDIIGGRL